MTNPLLNRRTFLTGTLAAAALGATACAATDTTTSTTSSTNATPASTASTASASGSSAASATGSAGAEPPTLDSLVSEVQDTFQQFTYDDTQTGKSLPYNLFLPDAYDGSKTYPIVLYIADSSLVGQDVTAPLSQYGALIWAAASEQAKHEAIVLVPEYPSVIIDDHGSFTTTDYVEMTTRLLSSVQDQYSVDPARVYGTGQSMGCMTVMYLAAQHPELFAAELFVSGQWDITQIQGLTQEKFFYIAAGGDENASGGQTDVQGMLTTVGVPFQTATWDATWSAEQFAKAAAELFAAGDSVNFATFETGTVLEVAGSSTSSSSGPGGSSEHMASFEPAYKITALRDWLFEQTA